MLCIIQEGDSMFYLRRQLGFFKYEVVDTKDGVAEIYTEQALNTLLQEGIDVVGYSYTHIQEFSSDEEAYKFYRGDLIASSDVHTVGYNLADAVNNRSCMRVFNLMPIIDTGKLTDTGIGYDYFPDGDDEPHTLAVNKLTADSVDCTPISTSQSYALRNDISRKYLDEYVEPRTIDLLTSCTSHQAYYGFYTTCTHSLRNVYTFKRGSWDEYHFSGTNIRGRFYLVQRVYHTKSNILFGILIPCCYDDGGVMYYRVPMSMLCKHVTTGRIKLVNGRLNGNILEYVGLDGHYALNIDIISRVYEKSDLEVKETGGTKYLEDGTLVRAETVNGVFEIPEGVTFVNCENIRSTDGTTSIYLPKTLQKVVRLTGIPDWLNSFNTREAEAMVTLTSKCSNWMFIRDIVAEIDPFRNRFVDNYSHLVFNWEQSDKLGLLYYLCLYLLPHGFDRKIDVKYSKNYLLGVSDNWTSLCGLEKLSPEDLLMFVKDAFDGKLKKGAFLDKQPSIDYNDTTCRTEIYNTFGRYDTQLYPVHSRTRGLCSSASKKYKLLYSLGLVLDWYSKHCVITEELKAYKAVINLAIHRSSKTSFRMAI